MALETGQTVDDRYRVVEKLAQGGMGAVYRAWDTRLSRHIALKEMVPQPELDDQMLAELRQQFEREAQVLATLTHPNLVRVTDYFSWDGKEYLVMDFVEGNSLADLIKDEGAQPESEVLHWADMLLDALSYCHKQGIIHRDVKPQNIIITPEGLPVLVDFGLVKLWNPEDPNTRAVMRGAGTPEYAPPEQYDVGLGHTDPRSDVYALGATIYHALTGRIPPTATQRMANPSSFVPPHRINVVLDPQVEGAILRSMAVAMDQRFQSADEMSSALKAAVGKPQPSADRSTHPKTEVLPADQLPEPKKSRIGLWLGLGGVAIICIAVAAAASVFFVRFLRSRGDVTPTPEVAIVTPTVAEDTVSPTFTPMPRPTVVPTIQPTNPPPPPPTNPPPITGGQVLFQDDFSDPASGWEETDFEAGAVGYGDGAYFANTYQSGGMVWGTASLSFSDVVIDVDVTQTLGPSNNNNGFGVMCRVQPNDDSYLLRISGDGYYAIHRVNNGAFEALVDWTSTGVVRQGNATNHIRAVCDGTRLALIVNGELLAEVDDAAYTEGEVGLAATTFEEETTEIEFDNLVIASAGQGPAAGGDVLRDDFSDPNSGWEIGDYDQGSVGYGDGYYFVTSVEDGSTMWGVAYRNFGAVTIDVDATQVRAPSNNNNGYGVKCMVQPGGTGGDGYAMLVSGDGYYSIYLVIDGDYQALVEWTPSEAINQGYSTNHIQAVCDGSSVALYVNDVFLTEVQDSTYQSGDISLMAVTLEADPTEIHFDNLVAVGPGGGAGGQTPPPATGPAGATLFEDDFGDPSTGWEDVGFDSDGGSGYENGYYKIVGAQDGIMVWGVAYRSFGDLVIDVDATQIDAPANDNNAYGVMCRVQPGPSGDGYAFLVSGDGYYTIQYVTKGDYEPLVAWETSDAVRLGNSTNHLRVTCAGSSLALEVNGQLVATVDDSNYAEGDIALLAGTLETESTEIHFDNLVVSSPLP